MCRILQFDVDGDHALIAPNKTLIECVPTDKNILYYEGFDADKPQITKEAIYKALVASMDNSNIGDISNVMTKNYNNANAGKMDEVAKMIPKAKYDTPKPKEVTQNNQTINVTQDINVNCPNVTNTTGAEYLVKALRKASADVLVYNK